MSQVTSTVEKDKEVSGKGREPDFTPDTRKESSEQRQIIFTNTSTPHIKESPVNWKIIKNEIDIPLTNNLSLDDNIKSIEAKTRIEQEVKDRENNRNIKNNLFDLLKLIFIGVFIIYFFDLFLIAGGHEQASKEIIDISKQIVVMILGFLFGREKH